VVVYSVTDRASIKVAEDILHYLWRQNFTQDKSVIVVGNKADLARARVVPTTGELIKKSGSRSRKAAKPLSCI
jgi:GTPase SAR1 family protein